MPGRLAEIELQWRHHSENENVHCPILYEQLFSLFQEVVPQPQNQVCQIRWTSLSGIRSFIVVQGLLSRGGDVRGHRNTVRPLIVKQQLEAAAKFDLDGHKSRHSVRWTV